MNAGDPPQSLGPMVVVSSVDVGVLQDAADHHLRRVLRRGPGDAVVLCDGAGAWVPAVLGVGEGEVQPVGTPTIVEPPARVTTVAFALVKGDRPDGAVRHLTELGVGRIIPMVTERTVVRWPKKKAASAHERLVRVATEACQQCRRTHLPEVTPMTSFDDVLRVLDDGSEVALAVPGGDDASQQLDALLVGPEGGWAEGELERVERHRDIGAHILRAETAALVAGVMVTGSLGSR